MRLDIEKLLFSPALLAKHADCSLVSANWCNIFKHFIKLSVFKANFEQARPELSKAFG